MNAAVDMVALSAPVRRFVGEARQALIDGRWQAASGETFEVYDPATESVIARVADCKRADVDLAVAAARKALLAI
jgi:acyl-CoA reductase-like NAD-dependent aldehyde dehydrogenase